MADGQIIKTGESDLALELEKKVMNGLITFKRDLNKWKLLKK